MELVVISGASSGVGAEAARVFAKRGSRVVLLARSADKLATLAEEIGLQAVAMPCDASDPAAVAKVAGQVTEHYGTPDVILNCAGAGQWKTLQDTPAEEAKGMMDAPYFAAFNVTKAFLPGMLARGSGVVLHVNSPACMAAWRSSVGYTAARAALRGFHEALSQDLAGTGLHSCHVIFGKIASEYFRNNPGVAEKMPALARTLPTLTPEKCADALWTVAHHPRHSAIYPWALTLHLGFARFFPRLAAWALRF